MENDLYILTRCENDSSLYCLCVGSYEFIQESFKKVWEDVRVGLQEHYLNNEEVEVFVSELTPFDGFNSFRFFERGVDSLYRREVLIRFCKVPRNVFLRGEGGATLN